MAGVVICASDFFGRLAEQNRGYVQLVLLVYHLQARRAVDYRTAWKRKMNISVASFRRLNGGLEEILNNAIGRLCIDIYGPILNVSDKKLWFG